MKIPSAKVREPGFLKRLADYLIRVGLETEESAADEDSSMVLAARHPGGEWMPFFMDEHGSIVTPSDLDKLVLKFVDAGNDAFLDAPLAKAKEVADYKRESVRDQSALLAAKCMLPDYRQVLDAYSAFDGEEGRSNVEKSLKGIAHFSYAFADAMLAARDK